MPAWLVLPSQNPPAVFCLSGRSRSTHSALLSVNGFCRYCRAAGLSTKRYNRSMRNYSPKAGIYARSPRCAGSCITTRRSRIDADKHATRPARCQNWLRLHPVRSFLGTQPQSQASPKAFTTTDIFSRFSVGCDIDQQHLSAMEHAWQEHSERFTHHRLPRAFERSTRPGSVNPSDNPPTRQHSTSSKYRWSLDPDNYR